MRRFATARAPSSPARRAGLPAARSSIKAQPAGATAYTTVATVKPAGGRWRLSVAPKITTRYLIAYGGATTDRLLRVRPDLRVARKPAARSGLAQARRAASHATSVFLFRLGPTGAWSQVRQSPHRPDAA